MHHHVTALLWPTWRVAGLQFQRDWGGGGGGSDSNVMRWCIGLHERLVDTGPNNENNSVAVCCEIHEYHLDGENR